jgi:uncharacterized LabA/DUF88 family protein
VNPWWLRPPAEEGPAKQEKAKKPAPKTQEKQQVEKQEEKAAPGQGPSGRSRGGRRRRSPAAKGRRKTADQRRIAVFFDAESLAQEFDLDLMLGRLADRGRLIAKRAYGDWRRYGDQETALRAAGLEIVDSPPGPPSGSGSAEIRLAIDAVELGFSKDPCEVFIIVSANGDFAPLVAKLRETKVEVIGVGHRESVAADLAAVYDEFLYVEELSQPSTPEPEASGVDAEQQPVFTLLVETIKSLEPGSEGILWGSTLKQEMRRRQPELDLSGLGYATFTDLLEDAERHEVIRLERDDRSGSYYVVGLGEE